MALYGAYGLYAAIALQGPAAAAGELTAETIPGSPSSCSRTSCSAGPCSTTPLLVRDKLFPGGARPDPALRGHRLRRLVRVVLVILLTIANVGRMGWLILALALLFAGMLLKRILEEAVAAEERPASTRWTWWSAPTPASTSPSAGLPRSPTGW